MASVRNTTLVGYYARVDCFGRLFFDQCRTDEEHLLNTEIPEGDDRPRCRVYADDLMPKDVLGWPSNWTISIRCDPDRDPREEDPLAEDHFG